MTEWKARRAKRPAPDLDNPGPRLLCGYHFGVNFCAEAPIAWIIGDPADPPALLAVPVGLVAVAPGVYEWTSAARGKLAAGRSPNVRDPRGRPTSSPMIGRAAREYLIADPAARYTVPCRKGHRNLIALDVPKV